MRGRGVLKQVRLLVCDKELRGFGVVEEDSRGRFQPGSRIVTSPIIAVDGNVLRTENTDYMVLGPTYTSLDMFTMDPSEKECEFLTDKAKRWLAEEEECQG